MQPDEAEAKYLICDTRQRFDGERYVTFWREKGQGYCWPVSWAWRLSRSELESEKKETPRFRDGDRGPVVMFAVREDLIADLLEEPRAGDIDLDAGPVIRNSAEMRMEIMKRAGVPLSGPADGLLNDDSLCKVAGDLVALAGRRDLSLWGRRDLRNCGLVIGAADARDGLPLQDTEPFLRELEASLDRETSNPSLDQGEIDTLERGIAVMDRLVSMIGEIKGVERHVPDARHADPDLEIPFT